MHNHFDKYLNVKQLILDYKPKWIVELGAGSGENTRQFLDLKPVYGFPEIVHVVSDGPLMDGWENEIVRGNLKWEFGLSYLELPKFLDNSILFCSIDTDHNSWTVKKELDILEKKMQKDGIIVIHDTESFKGMNGFGMSYGCGSPYLNEILEDTMPYDERIREIVDLGPWRVIQEVIESSGAIAIQRM